MAEEIVQTSLIELTEWEHTLCRSLRSYQPGLFVQTLEENRVMLGFLRVCQYMAQRRWKVRPIIRWSAISAIRINLKTPQAPEKLEQQELFECVSKFVEEEPEAGLLVLADIRETVLNDPTTVRLLREATERICREKKPKTIVILGRPFDLPAEIRADFPVLEFAIPDTAHLKSVFRHFLTNLQKFKPYENIRPTEDIIQGFATAATGLSENETLGLIALALARYEEIDERAIKMAQEEKGRALLRGNSLQMTEPRCGLDGVGGLEGLKAWIQQVTPIIQDPGTARQYGLRIPSGLLMVGIPGCGKSLLCEALAAHWRLPLLRFDVGAAFGSLVGESEANIRQMQQMADALKPCVVYVDEIEKGLGGDSLDGGTTNRVKQSLLTWLNDKSDQIFVVATANDLRKLMTMPELIRAGRFDKTFFVDLPDMRARADIFKIHFDRAKHPLPAAVIRAAAKRTEGYSGAEIEAIAQTSLREAFSASPRPEHPTQKMVMNAVAGTKPLSATMREAIDKLRDWCKEGRAEPAGRMIEDDKREQVIEEQARSEAAGLPVILGDMGICAEEN